VLEATTVVSLSHLDELRGITPTSDGGLRIGALTPIADLAAAPVIKEKYRAISDAAAVVASPQLRNQGTLGGNLCQKPRCWYYRGEIHCLRKGGDTCFAYEGESEIHALFGGDRCYVVHPSDTAPALVALGATAKVVGPGGSRLVPLKDLHVPAAVDPQRETVLERGEILTSVVLPPPAEGQRSSYRKVRTRAAWDFALAAVALSLNIKDGVVQDAHVVLGGVAATPWIATAAEDLLEKSRLDGQTIARAADAVLAGAAPLAKNGYKIPLLRGLVVSQLEALANG
jgi:xanthine dehydrogenase YagS FAD-binding subunit